MSGPRPGSKIARELVERLRPGFTVHATGDSKLYVRDPNGRLLRRPDGRPFKIPNTPARKTGKAHLALLRKMGAVD